MGISGCAHPRCATLTAAVLLCLTLPGGLAAQTSRTSLVLHNGTSEAQTVGIVLAALDAPGGVCDASNPPVTADQLQERGFCTDVINSRDLAPYAGRCSLTLAPGATVAFPDIPNTCLSGNVTFGGFASCPNDVFPGGTTTAEFTLNPKTGADEVIDVSLVNGFSSTTTMSVAGGDGWSYGADTPITDIVPRPVGANLGDPGVFPQNCTDCVRLVGPPVCPGFSPTPTCQEERICNVRRSATGSGGTVTIALQPALGGPAPGLFGAIGPLGACAGLPTDAAADFFANVQSLQDPDGALVQDAVCPSFCRKAKLACTQVAQLARGCVDRERVFARVVAEKACQAADDPASCRDDLKQTIRQDRADTRADFEAARAFCHSEVLEDCLARCDGR